MFLGEDDALLYIGKARSLHRRLADHGRSKSRRLARVRDVRWIECADEDSKLLVSNFGRAESG